MFETFVRPEATLFIADDSAKPFQIPTPEGVFVIRTIPFAELQTTVDLSLEAELIIAPLIARRFDAVDLVLAASGAGFEGHLLFFHGGLPRGDLVRRELTLASAGPRISLVQHAHLTASGTAA